MPRRNCSGFDPSATTTIRSPLPVANSTRVPCSDSAAVPFRYSTAAPPNGLRSLHPKLPWRSPHQRAHAPVADRQPFLAARGRVFIQQVRGCQQLAVIHLRKRGCRLRRRSGDRGGRRSQSRRRQKFPPRRLHRCNPPCRRALPYSDVSSTITVAIGAGVCFGIVTVTFSPSCFSLSPLCLLSASM